MASFEALPLLEGATFGLPPTKAHRREEVRVAHVLNEPIGKAV